MTTMTTKSFQFANGDLVRDKITGYQGTITGTAFYLTGCNSYLVTSKARDEYSEPLGLWYDEGRLELIQKNLHTEESVQADDNGSDRLPNIGKRGF
jgi:hypothetical protein